MHRLFFSCAEPFICSIIVVFELFKLTIIFVFTILKQLQKRQSQSTVLLVLHNRLVKQHKLCNETYCKSVIG